MPLKTRDVLIEVCPKSNTLHAHFLTEGVIENTGRDSMPCGAKLQNDTTCDYEVKVKPENTFRIRRWNYRERQQFYSLVGVYSSGGDANVMRRGALDIKTMDWVITHSITNSPFPLKDEKDLENPEIDGSILETIYTLALDFNASPLAPSSASPLQSSPETPAPAETTQ